MRYVVYNNKTGQIVRTYRKILAEGGEEVPADESEILSNLPLGLSKDDVAVIALKEVSFERGETYRVDLGTGRIVGEKKNKR